MGIVEATAADIQWMKRALELAKLAETKGEVPVGAVLIKGDTLIGEGYNAPISNSDPTCHAEIQAIRSACSTAQNYRLLNTTLYVTLEPCPMCAGAILQARIERVVFGASEPKWGAAGSLCQLLQHSAFNHQAKVLKGVLKEESADMLKQFFRGKRKNRTLRATEDL